MKRILTLIFLGLHLTLAALGQVAPVPSLMNFQGRLTKPDGTPVPDGNYSLRFSLWTAASGGVEKWNQTLSGVQSKNGVFAATLGGLPETAFDGNLWLEIKIGTNTPLTPRQPLVSVAYAMKANTVPDSAITSSKIADSAVTNGKIAEGAITLDRLASDLRTYFTPQLPGPSSGVLGAAATNAPPNALSVQGGYVYVTTSDAVNGSLQAFDISAPTMPLLISTLSNIPSARSVVTRGQYAYLLSGNSLQVMDVSNPRQIQRVGTVDAPAPGMSPPLSLFVQGNLVYTLLRDSNRLVTIDVTNPTAPQVMSRVLTESLPITVAVEGNYAYVITSLGLLQIFNVTSPVFPFMVSTLNVSPYGSPQGLAVRDGYAYLAMTGTPASLRIFNVSNPASPSLTSSVALAGNSSSLLTVQGNYATVGSSLPTGRNFVQRIDLSDPASPLVVGTSIPDSQVKALLPYLENQALFFIDYHNAIYTAGPGIVNTEVPNNHVVDPNGLNMGTLLHALTFGGNRREGIASKRNNGGNQYGLDFFTNNLIRLSITNAGNIGIRTTAPDRALTVAGVGGAYLNLKDDGGREVLLGADGNGGIVSTMTNHDLLLRAGGNSNKVIIKADGNVGIGTISPGYKLHVNGSVAGVGNYNNVSDARYKQNVATFPDALNTILNLRGVTFDWKKNDYPTMNFSEGSQIGFIAQEVEKVLPELVITDANGDKSVAYANVVPVLVEAMKQQQKQREADRVEVKTLKEENAVLRAENHSRGRRISELEARLDALSKIVGELKALHR